VQAFYASLKRREWHQAYTFLSTSYRAEHPFVERLAYFAQVASIEVNDIQRESYDEVSVTSTLVVDRSHGSRAGITFQGRCRLVFCPSELRWHLDSTGLPDKHPETNVV
jgi:hypothetical protein